MILYRANDIFGRIYLFVFDFNILINDEKYY